MAAVFQEQLGCPRDYLRHLEQESSLLCMRTALNRRCPQPESDKHHISLISILILSSEVRQGYQAAASLHYSNKHLYAFVTSHSYSLSFSLGTNVLFIRSIVLSKHHKGSSLRVRGNVFVFKTKQTKIVIYRNAEALSKLPFSKYDQILKCKWRYSYTELTKDQIFRRSEKRTNNNLHD